MILNWASSWERHELWLELDIPPAKPCLLHSLLCTRAMNQPKQKQWKEGRLLLDFGLGLFPEKTFSIRHFICTRCVHVPRLHAHGPCPVILNSGRWHFSSAPTSFLNLLWAVGLLAPLDLCFCSLCLSPSQLPVSCFLLVLCNWLFANLFGYLLNTINDKDEGDLA